MVAAAEGITLRAAEAATLRTALRVLGKFASKVAVAGLLASFLLDNGDLSCEQGPLYMRARPVFKEAADALKRAAAAGYGPQRKLNAEFADVQRRVNGLKTFILKDNKVVKECSGPNKVALAVIKKLYPTLAAAEARLAARAVKPPTKKECAVAKKGLRQFRRLVKRYSPGTTRKRLDELQRLLDEGKLRPVDLPAGAPGKIPSRFLEKTLRQIEEECRNAI